MTPRADDNMAMKHHAGLRVYHLRFPHQEACPQSVSCCNKKTFKPSPILDSCLIIFLLLTKCMAEPPPPGPRPFQPGVAIDWEHGAVEVDARVVLREGPLELLACSPQTKEHESILAVQGRPFHIFQAMGLVGLDPGSPARYDEKTNQWFGATGESLDLLVRWREGGKERTTQAAAWMLEKKTGKPPEALGWVFAGSVTRDQGGFAADEEGTVACVVDFDSALIAPSVRHSSDDAELWLTANPDRIPPRGTPCTLIIRSAYHPRLTVEVVSKDRFRLGDDTLTGEQLADRLVSGRDERTALLIVIHSGMSDSQLKEVRADLELQLHRRNIDPMQSLKLRPRTESQSKKENQMHKPD